MKISSMPVNMPCECVFFIRLHSFPEQNNSICMQSGLRASAWSLFLPLICCLIWHCHNCTVRKECISSSVSLHSEKYMRMCTATSIFPMFFSLYIFLFESMCFIIPLIYSHSLRSCSLPQTLSLPPPHNFWWNDSLPGGDVIKVSARFQLHLLQKPTVLSCKVCDKWNRDRGLYRSTWLF